MGDQLNDAVPNLADKDPQYALGYIAMALQEGNKKMAALDSKIEQGLARTCESIEMIARSVETLNNKQMLAVHEHTTHKELCAQKFVVVQKSAEEAISRTKRDYEWLKRTEDTLEVQQSRVAQVEKKTERLDVVSDQLNEVQTQISDVQTAIRVAKDIKGQSRSTVLYVFVIITSVISILNYLKPLRFVSTQETKTQTSHQVSPQGN